MPVRPRRRREHRLELTLRRCLALELGPTPLDLATEPLERLREVWVEYRARFGPDSWAANYWEHGRDIRLVDPYNPAVPVGCPGCDD